MTAISTIISKRGITFASDSIISIYDNKTNSYKVLEYNKPKIIAVEKYHAALAYYGLAKYKNWNTYDWIKGIIKGYPREIDLNTFSEYLKVDLNNKLNEFFPDKLDIRRGIGIHLAGYLKLENEIIPELFHISNFTNPLYNEIGELNASPQLFDTLAKLNQNNVNIRPTTYCKIKKSYRIFQSKSNDFRILTDFS